jgi:dinuclear metal center YbgI/SA1388 family protein
MNVEEVLDYINELAPWKYAEEWDNVGLMLGSRTNQVKKLMLCMDVTSQVIDEAMDQEANLIVSHHPFLFSKLNTVDLDTMKGQQISTLIKNDINVISAHTNLDVAVGGVNDTLAEAVGLTNCGILKSYIPEGFDVNMGMGKVGELPARLCFEEFICIVKKNLDIVSLRLIGVQPKTIKKVAVFCGSFDVDLDIIKRHEVDVLITGDMKYHTALDAREMGLCILDVGHYASEHLILNKFKKLLENRFDNLEVICSTLEKDPFIFS